MRIAQAMLLAIALGLSYSDGGRGVDQAPASRDAVSSLSYKGHENDEDANNLIASYPALLGTRLDDCQTCHRGGSVAHGGGRPADLNPCSYCHLIPFPDSSVTSGAPLGMEATLNRYGLDYKRGGRTPDALAAIEDRDSDGDGFANRVELDATRYPGDPGSKPGQSLAPAETLSWETIEGLPQHRQFLLLNSHKQRFDEYASFTGVKVSEILDAVGADSTARSITIIAPDGYAVDFDLARIRASFPRGVFHGGLDPGSFEDPARGFVRYPAEEHLPDGIAGGGQIPGEQWAILAHASNGRGLEGCRLDLSTGRLDGDGPYRLVVPQSDPGSPDRGSSYDTKYGDGWDYDPAKDHNAGLCVRGVAAIRVNPLPEGYEEFDWKNGGWALIERKRVLVYGAGVRGRRTGGQLGGGRR